MHMKYKNILELNQSLNSINLKGPKFAYGIAKNVSILKPEVDSFTKASESTDEYKEYDKQRVEICKKYAEKDKDGKEIIENNEFKIINRKEFNLEIEDLNKKNQSIIDERASQLDELNELLEKDIEVVLHKIKLADVPEDITTQELKDIFDLIEE